MGWYDRRLTGHMAVTEVLDTRVISIVPSSVTDTLVWLGLLKDLHVEGFHDRSVDERSGTV